MTNSNFLFINIILDVFVYLLWRNSLFTMYCCEKKNVDFDFDLDLDWMRKTAMSTRTTHDRQHQHIFRIFTLIYLHLVLNHIESPFSFT